MAAYTEAPWEATYNNKLGQWTLRYQRSFYAKDEDRDIAVIWTSLDDAKDAATAAFIVRAVNAYAADQVRIALLEAELRDLRKLNSPIP